MPTKETRAEKARRLNQGHPLEASLRDWPARWAAEKASRPVTIPEPTITTTDYNKQPRCGWCGEPAVRLGPVNAFWPPREQPLIVSWSCAGHLFWLSLAQEVN